jgi:phosphoserine phosphatase RsbU/P
MKNEELERLLFLKQLQINRLLDITQAINNNVKAEGLYDMYRSFLNWEMGVRRIALYLPHEDSWKCAVHTGLDPVVFKKGHDIIPFLPSFGNIMRKLNDLEHPFSKLFEIVIPVFHKDLPIAYAFLGDYEVTDFSKIQLITTITNIIAVAIENKKLFKQQIEREQINHEINLASKMQRNLVPSELPKNDILDLSSIYEPHFAVGGDFFDCIHYRDDRYLLCVADVSGKGLAAALLMSNFQANLHAILRRASSPEEFIRQLNKAVWRITKSDSYITFFAAEIDLNTRRLRYINSGHVAPLLVLKGGEAVHWLEKGSSILGYFENLPHVEVGEVYLEDDALLVIFTDGLSDIKNKAGVNFDEAFLESFALENYTLEAASFNKELMQKIEAFNSQNEIPDDITVLTCKFLKKSERLLENASAQKVAQ